MVTVNELSIDFPFPPLSQNNIERTGARTNHRYKTQEALIYRDQIALTLNNHIKDVRLFLADFDQEVHGLIVSYVWYLNAEKILLKKRNKAGVKRLSARGLDAFNAEKYTTDCIFNTLGIDDVFIIDGHVKKRPSMDSGSIHANFKIVPLDSIPEFKSFL